MKNEMPIKAIKHSPIRAKLPTKAIKYSPTRTKLPIKAITKLSKTANEGSQVFTK